MAHCLIVEDSGTMRTVMVRILTDLGHHVSEAQGPASTADACDAEMPDVILLDWDLPGLGALDVLRVIHERSAKRKPEIILLATENDPRLFALARAAGAGPCVLKPFGPNALATALAEIGYGPRSHQLADFSVSAGRSASEAPH